MKLIVGLGNPGDKYKDTWHNAGFLVLDEYLKQYNSGKFLGRANFKMSQFKAEIVEMKLGEEKIVLAKPLIFMNNSGDAVQKLANFFHIKPEDIMIIHDDIDIELGKIKIAFDSSSAGHNGIKSIIARLGTQKFNRIRVGIKSEKQGQIPTEKYVLQKIDKDGKMLLDKAITEAIKSLETNDWL